MDDAALLALRRELGILTEEEVAALAGIDMRTLANQRSARTGPPYTKWGRAIFYRVDALTRWLQEREEQTQP